MPAKKREVVSFVARLNPTLVRKLDAYARLSNRSRNQVIEEWLEQHFAMLGPHSPGVLGNIVVNFLAEIVIEGRFVESGQFFLQFHAENGVRHTCP